MSFSYALTEADFFFQRARGKVFFGKTNLDIPVSGTYYVV
jgi:hypothetical protein